MSDESIEDLFAVLPPSLHARKAELEALLEGTLAPEARARLEAEAEQDDDLAYALTLYTPFDAEQMSAVEGRIAEALPAKLAVIDGGGQPAPAPAPADKPAAKARGPWLVGGMLAAAAAVVITFVPKAPSVPFEVLPAPQHAYAPGEAVKLELKARGKADVDRVTVLAVAGDTVHRTDVPVTRDGDRLKIDAPTQTVVGALVGVVDVLVLPPTDTDPQGRISAADVRQMMDKLARDRAATALVVQPPAYALAVTAEGTMRSAPAPKAATASTALEVPGRVTFHLRPDDKAKGAVVVHLFVSREGADPVGFQAPRVRADNAAFLVEAPTAAVLQEADRATVYLLVGPEGAAAPDPRSAPAAPWRRVVHHVYRVTK